MVAGTAGLVWGAVLAREAGVTPESLTQALPGDSPDEGDGPAAAPAPAEGVEFGVALPAQELGSAGALEGVAGRSPQRVTYVQSWAQARDFDPALADQIREQGMQPLLAWEPTDLSRQPQTDQPEFALQTIIDGNHDDFLRRWAEQIRDWGHPLWIRFAYEANEDIHPWSAEANGNSPDQYVQAYRHVVDVFREAGATNVAWNWSVAVQPTGVALADVYPGDDFVDEFGVDGYNAGTELDWGGWKTFGEVFGPTLEELGALADKPIHLAEVASSEEGGSKAEWITDFFAQIQANPDITGFTWVNLDKESSGQADWQIQTSPEAEQAFQEGLATLG